MSLKCDWMVLCERVTQDSDSRNLILFQTIETIRSLAFPVLHKGFAFAARFHWEGPVAEQDTTVFARFVRWSEHDPEEVVVEVNGPWKARTVFGKSYFNFDVLRLFRPEMIWFRLDLRVGADGDWATGLSVPIQVAQLEATPELLQRQAAREKLIEELAKAAKPQQPGKSGKSSTRGATATGKTSTKRANVSQRRHAKG